MRSINAVMVACALTLGSIGALGARELGSASAVPHGWFVTGTHPRDYVMTTDTTVRFEERPSAQLRSVVPAPSGFGALMQVIAADAYRGRRVRFTGWLRGSELTGTAAVWLRADDACDRVVAFDNSERSSVPGTSSWQRHEVVLDIPGEARTLSLGTLLSRGGTVWVSGARFEIVADSVAVTAAAIPAEDACRPASVRTGQAYASAPVNLGFAAVP